MSTLFDSVLRPTIIAAARSERIKQASQRWSTTEKVVRRFVPGESLDDVLTAIRRELDDGLAVTIDFLGEDTVDESHADATVAAYVALLQAMPRLAPVPPGSLEVSLKLTALGQRLPEHGAKIAEENARTIAEAARSAGASVTVDAEDHSTVDERLAVVRSLRRDFPPTSGPSCRHISGAPRTTAPSSRSRVRESGCARAPMPNHRRSPTPTVVRSTRRTSAAFES